MTFGISIKHHFVECHFGECRYAKCHYGECSGADSCSTHNFRYKLKNLIVLEMTLELTLVQLIEIASCQWNNRLLCNTKKLANRLQL
jgi:hypothetical protein